MSSDLNHAEWAADFVTQQMKSWNPAQMAHFFLRISSAQAQLPQAWVSDQQLPATEMIFDNNNELLTTDDFNLLPGCDTFSVISPAASSIYGASPASTNSGDVASPATKNARGSKTQQKERRTKKMLARNGTDPDAVKRPKGVNAFMAFRAYYCVIFAHSGEQRLRSAMVSQLWASDLFRREWTVIASAYSIIRDQVGKDNAPIKVFLDIVCPWAGLPAPIDQGTGSDYVSAYGYTLTVGPKLEMPAKFPSRENFKIRPVFTEQDVIAHCQSKSYPEEMPLEDASSSNLTMTTSAPPIGEVASMMPPPVPGNVSMNMESLFQDQDFSNLFSADGTSFDYDFNPIPQDVGVNFAPGTTWTN